MSNEWAGAIIQYSLFTIQYSLFITHYSLLVIYYSNGFCGEEAAGDVAAEGDELVAFFGLEGDEEFEPEEDGGGPFDEFFEDAAEVFFA